MADRLRHSGTRVVVFLSLVAAMLLMVMPLPQWAVMWKPLWPVMVLMYWCMALPDRIGYTVALIVGLCLDTHQGTLLGQNVLSLTILVFIINHIYRYLRLIPFVQQSLIVFALCVQYLLVNFVVSVMHGIPPDYWDYWLPAVTSMFMWPWLFILLRDLRRGWA